MMSPGWSRSSPRRLFWLYVPFMLLVIIGSCSEGNDTEGDSEETSGRSNTSVLPPTSTQSSGTGAGGPAYSCEASTGGEIQLDVLNEVPRREDVQGAGPLEDAATPNEETLPPTPTDPDGVIPDLGAVPIAIEPPLGAQNDPQADDFVFYRLPTTVDGRGNTSTIAEPDIAFDGQRALLTWNYFAGVSSDGGASFDYLSPWQFPSVDGGFCCDQLAFHVPARRLWLWYLQYWPDTAGENTIRLAFTDNTGLESGDWTFVDWEPDDLGLPDGTFIDYPHVAASDEYLYLTTNTYMGDVFAQAVVVRVPLDALIPGNSRSVPASCLIPVVPGFGDEPRHLASVMPTKGATDTMYLAGHVTNSTLGIFKWPDEAAVPTFVTVTDFDDEGNTITYPRDSGVDYECPRANSGPQSDWCVRSDDRLTSAWIANGRIGFAWNAQQITERVRFPFVWVVVLDERGVDLCTRGECVLDYPYILHDDFAIQYAAIDENPRGELGAVALMGGGTDHLTCAALTHDPIGGWRYLKVGVSNSDLPLRSQASKPLTGDYLGIAPDGDGSRSWLGTCMSYSQDPGANEGSMLVHVARFGLLKDDPVR